jgi:hypothetical protein
VLLDSIRALGAPPVRRALLALNPFTSRESLARMVPLLLAAGASANVTVATPSWAGGGGVTGEEDARRRGADSILLLPGMTPLARLILLGGSTDACTHLTAHGAVCGIASVRHLLLATHGVLTFGCRQGWVVGTEADVLRRADHLAAISEFKGMPSGGSRTLRSSPAALHGAAGGAGATAPPHAAPAITGADLHCALSLDSERLVHMLLSAGEVTDANWCLPHGDSAAVQAHADFLRSAASFDVGAGEFAEQFAGAVEQVKRHAPGVGGDGDVDAPRHRWRHALLDFFHHAPLARGLRNLLSAVREESGPRSSLGACPADPAAQRAMVVAALHGDGAPLMRGSVSHWQRDGLPWLQATRGMVAAGGALDGMAGPRGESEG